MTDRTSAWTAAARAAVDRFDPRPGRRQALVAWFAHAFSRTLMTRLNHLEILNGARLQAARRLQRPGHGLLTFSNHAALFDDPWLTSCISGHHWPDMRWVAVDSLNFFGSDAKARLFNMGKCVPIVRGVGLDQPGMHYLAERLKNGDWVHLFPEGTRSRDPEGRVRQPLKPGLAWLVDRARPLLLGFHHRGMHEVLPIGARVPRVGKTVTIRMGEVRDSRDGLAEEGAEAITDWAGDELVALEREAFGEG